MLTRPAAGVYPTGLMRIGLIAAAVMVLASVCFAGEDDFRVQAPALSFRAQPEAQPRPARAPDQTPGPSAGEKKGIKPFGTPGAEYWSLAAGAAYDFNEEATDFNIRGAYSVFIIRDVEFSLELNAWYFDQPGNDALGVNPSMDFKWHFYNGEPEGSPWSFFADLGIGLLVASDEVPDGGTAFDFMPKFGLGLTRKLDDAGTRLEAGIQWHHVSNARITGDEKNPGRDAPFLYVGLMWPF
jgi:lipid A 3-O-deacylase